MKNIKLIIILGIFFLMSQIYANTPCEEQLPIVTTEMLTESTVLISWTAANLCDEDGNLVEPRFYRVTEEVTRDDIRTNELFVVWEGLEPNEQTEFELTAAYNEYHNQFVWIIINEKIPLETKRSSSCNDCEPPTLGLNSNYKRIVDNGFSYNGNFIDVERYFTPYPLITVNIGESNTAVFKIYENSGIQNIKHISFAFGLARDDIISNSKAIIELDIDYDGTETVTVYDPQNALDDINVATDVVDCMSGSTAQCLEVTMEHMFRAPLDFNIVATDVWDQKRNAWQNYFNHGIKVVGESLNPAKEYDGINAGQIYHLIETSKTTAVDEFGNSWSLEYGLWKMDYIQAPRVQDTPTEIMTRHHSEFAQYKETQIRKAIDTLILLYPPFHNFPGEPGEHKHEWKIKEITFGR